MRRFAPWLPRAGAALAAAAFFLPQAGFGGRWHSPFSLCTDLGGLLPLSEYLYHVLWLLGPLLLPLLLLSAVMRPDPDSGGLRWVLFVILLLASFSLSTLGSILLTTVDAGAQASRPPAALALAIFVLPLLAAATAVGRVLGGGDPRATGRIVRASLGLLLALHSLFVLGWWWGFYASWTGNSPGETMPAAWSPFAGGLLVAVGEIHLLVRPPAPAPAPAAA